MPTPFTHLAYAHRWLEDSSSDAVMRIRLQRHLPDFLLGSIAADARVPSVDSRAATHFYTYTDPMTEHPWRVMLAQHPTLLQLASDGQALVAGYVFHLAMDEYWSLHMLEPHFANAKWGSDRAERFRVLHLLLISMDERDRDGLPASDAHTLLESHPHGWLPFMSDTILIDWAAFMARQIVGDSQTLEIFGGRIQQSPAQLRAILDAPDQMQAVLYQHLSRTFLADFEQRMYDFASQQLDCFLLEQSI